MTGLTALCFAFVAGAAGESSRWGWCVVFTVTALLALAVFREECNR